MSTEGLQRPVLAVELLLLPHLLLHLLDGRGEVHLEWLVPGLHVRGQIGLLEGEIDSAFDAHGSLLLLLRRNTGDSLHDLRGLYVDVLISKAIFLELATEHTDVCVRRP